MKDENERLGRWALQLTNMKYKIVHKLGRIHNNADCLSRIQSVANISEADNTTSLSQEQSKDPLCNEMKNYLDEGLLTEDHTNNPPQWVKQIYLYYITNGILCKDFLPTEKNVERTKQFKSSYHFP